MVPIRHEVNIAMDSIIGVTQQGRSLDDHHFLKQSRAVMFDDLVRCGKALKAARARQAPVSSATPFAAAAT